MISVWSQEEHRINLIFDMVLPHGYDKEEENTLQRLVTEKSPSSGRALSMCHYNGKEFCGRTKRKVREGSYVRD